MRPRGHVEGERPRGGRLGSHKRPSVAARGVSRARADPQAMPRLVRELQTLTYGRQLSDAEIERALGATSVQARGLSMSQQSGNELSVVAD